MPSSLDAAHAPDLALLSRRPLLLLTSVQPRAADSTELTSRWRTWLVAVPLAADSAISWTSDDYAGLRAISWEICLADPHACPAGAFGDAAPDGTGCDLCIEGTYAPAASTSIENCT